MSGYMQKPKALLIDMDGTLVDTLPLLYEAYLSFLKSQGLMGTPQEFESLLGPSLSEIIVILKERYRLEGDASSLRDLYQEGLEEAYEQRVVLFPQALEVLHLAKSQGIKLAVVSAAEKQFVKAFVKGAGLLKVFDQLVASAPGILSKPHPDLYLKALELLGIQAKDALAVEDSLGGVIAATNAGIYTLWIKHNTMVQTNPLLAAPPFVPKTPYRKVTDWKEIKSYLEQWGGE